MKGLNGAYVNGVWVDATNTAQSFGVDSEGNIVAGGDYTFEQAQSYANKLLQGSSSFWDSLANFGSGALGLVNNVINSGTAQNAVDLYSKLSGQANKIQSSEVVAQQNSLYSTIAEQVKKNQMIIYAGVGLLGTYILIRAIKNKKSAKGA